MNTPSTPLISLNPGKRAGNGRPCIICQLPLKVRSALEERINRGEAIKPVLLWAQKVFPEAAALKYDATARHFRLHTAPMRRAAKKLSDADRMVRSQIGWRVMCWLTRSIRRRISPLQRSPRISRKPAPAWMRPANSAFADGEHASLASLSGQLLRATELRAKMGGSIREAGEVNLNVTIADLHARLRSDPGRL